VSPSRLSTPRLESSFGSSSKHHAPVIIAPCPEHPRDSKDCTSTGTCCLEYSRLDSYGQLSAARFINLKPFFVHGHFSNSCFLHHVVCVSFHLEQSQTIQESRAARDWLGVNVEELTRLNSRWISKGQRIPALLSLLTSLPCPKLVQKTWRKQSLSVPKEALLQLLSVLLGNSSIKMIHRREMSLYLILWIQSLNLQPRLESLKSV